MPSPRPEDLSALRRAVAGIEPGGRRDRDLFPLGAPDLDGWLGGGLRRGAVHEVYAAAGSDAAAAGFGLGLAARAAGGRPLVWVRQEEDDSGEVHGAGVAALGLDPGCLILVRTRDEAGALRAAAEAGRCAALGAVLAEFPGRARVIDLTASRRLALAAGASGTTLVVIRSRASPAPSAAESRWGIRAAASRPLEANAPGQPAFSAALLRHRGGLPARTWRLEWDRDSLSFACSPGERPVPAPLPRPVAPVPADRPAAAGGLRRAG